MQYNQLRDREFKPLREGTPQEALELVEQGIAAFPQTEGRVSLIVQAVNTGGASRRANLCRAREILPSVRCTFITCFDRSGIKNPIPLRMTRPTRRRTNR